MAETRTPHQIQAAERDALCRQEHGADHRCGLLELLADSDRELAAARLQRLSGISLKRRLAEPKPINGTPSDTNAKRRYAQLHIKEESMRSPKTETGAPTAKVMGGALGAAFSTLLIWGLTQAGLTIDEGVKVALATVITFAVGYLIPPAPRDTVVKE